MVVVRLLICLVALCALLFASCYAGTGTDKKNMREIYSYPAAVRDAALADPQLARLAPAKRPSLAVTFVLSLVVFAILLRCVAWVAQPGGFAATFVGLLLVGEGVNIFDLVVIDLVWWRNSPRVRLTGIDDPALYSDPRPHLAAFARGAVMFALAALLAALLA